jgi:hypothetical protein
MGTTEDLADKLARDTIEAMEKLGDDRLYMEIANAIGASSPTTEEAYLTAVRVRLAVTRAERLLARKLAEAGADGTIPAHGDQP